MKHILVLLLLGFALSLCNLSERLHKSGSNFRFIRFFRFEQFELSIR